MCIYSTVHVFTDSVPQFLTCEVVRVRLLLPCLLRLWAEFPSSVLGHSSCGGVEGICSAACCNKDYNCQRSRTPTFHLKWQSSALRGCCPLTYVALLSGTKSSEQQWNNKPLWLYSALVPSQCLRHRQDISQKETWVCGSRGRSEGFFEGWRGGVFLFKELPQKATCSNVGFMSHVWVGLSGAVDA